MERLKSLCKKERMVGESVKDTLIDWACYAVMTIAELERKETEDLIDNI